MDNESRPRRMTTTVVNIPAAWQFMVELVIDDFGSGRFFIKDNICIRKNDKSVFENNWMHR